MKKEDIIDIANDNNGYIYSRLVKENNIPTSLISRLEKEGFLTKLSRGVYITRQGVEDELFILSLTYSRIVYSGETALFLNGLSHKQSPIYEYSIPYGTFAPKIDGFNIKYSRKKTFATGITEVETSFGNKVRCYDKERCICDLFIRPDYYDYEDRVYAINEYKNNYINLKKLYEYAKELNVYDEVRNVFEVIGWN